MRKQQPTRKDYMPYDTILKYQLEVNYVVKDNSCGKISRENKRNDMPTIQDSVYSCWEWSCVQLKGPWITLPVLAMLIT